MRRYSAYKDSGIEWVGEMPDRWLAKPLFALFRERHVVNEGNQEANVLSLSYGQIIRRDIESNFGLLPESFETYNIIEPLNIVLRLTDLQNDKRSLRCGLAKEKGIITSAYLTLESIADIDCKYMYYLLHNYDIRKVFYSMGGGVRQTIKFADFKRLPMLLPSLEEQQNIASYIGRKIMQIDGLIAKKGRMMELLKEERAAIINQAVTKGLDPNAEMKDSDIEWLGKVPKHWAIEKLKFNALVQFSNVDKKSDETEIAVKLCNYVDVYYNDLITPDLAFMEATASLEEIKKFQLKIGDVILTKDSEEWDDIAIPAYVTFEKLATICGYHLAQVRPQKKAIHGKYLFWLLSASCINYQFRIEASGVTRYGLSNYALSNSVCLIPPMGEQEKISSFLDQKAAQIDAQIEGGQKSIEFLKEYRTSLISDVVTGKIDVRASAR